MSGVHPDEHSHAANRSQRRHFLDRQGKRHNTVARPTFTDRLREEYRNRRIEERSRRPVEERAIPTSGPGRRRAKAARNRPSPATFSPILPVSNEGHPFFQRRDPRRSEYTVC